MAGFTQHVPALVDIAMVAHPSVTVLIDLSAGDGLVYDARGRHGRGSAIVGTTSPGRIHRRPGQGQGRGRGRGRASGGHNTLPIPEGDERSGSARSVSAG